MRTPCLLVYGHLCVITPVHTKCIFMKLGLGLCVNSVEGREQKHQKIYKYMQNSTLLERWQFVFRHEFISCVYLRENGFDQKRYNKRIIPYVPSQKNGCCSCGLLFAHGSLQDVCDLCDSREFAFILKSSIIVLIKNMILNIHEIFVICWVLLIYQLGQAERGHRCQTSASWS